MVWLAIVGVVLLAAFIFVGLLLLGLSERPRQEP
jgi:L-asparagine transporter-like permease